MLKRIKKWFLRILLCVAVFGLAGWLVGGVLLQHWTAKPPPLPAETAIMQLKPEAHEGKVWLGKSWAGRREGLLVVYLKGSPLEIGYADGALMQNQMHVLENDFVKMIQGYVPYHWEMELLKDYVIYRNRHLSDYVAANYRLEIYGTTLGCRDIHPEEGSFYNRLLNYQAAHDVSYMMIDNAFVVRPAEAPSTEAGAGCTSFGAWGGATEEGHLLSGRNFDWEAAEVFSRDRVVMMVEPDGGIPFVSLAWAGMTGVVSGMNRAGVSITINGAPSTLPRDTATPAAILGRDILQTAHNLNEALAILRNAKVFVSTIWLVGSRADGKFIVVEKTPQATQVRETETDWIVCGNHFQTPGLKDDPRSKAYIQESTSASRAKRMTELMVETHGKLNASCSAEILRDRKLPGGVFAGNGHRGSLNALIATHATVMDLTDGIFWAASPPNQLGKFVAFDTRDFERELPDRTIAADEMLTSGEFEKARSAQRDLCQGQKAVKNKDRQSAFDQAEKAELLNPGFYQNAMLRGRALLALGKKEEAAKAFQAALAGQPAFQKERMELEQLLQEAKSR